MVNLIDVFEKNHRNGSLRETIYQEGYLQLFPCIFHQLLLQGVLGMLCAILGKQFFMSCYVPVSKETSP